MDRAGLIVVVVEEEKEEEEEGREEQGFPLLLSISFRCCILRYVCFSPFLPPPLSLHRVRLAEPVKLTPISPNF